jgi:hypothetical protein
MSEPMNPATINSSSLKISQNGVLLAGTITVSADNQDVVFTPNGGSFALGGYIQVFFTSSATDTAGNPLYNFQSSFRIQPDLSTTAPKPVSYYPCTYCSSYDRNTVVELLMNKPVDPATVTGANFYVTDTASHAIAGAITLLDNNQLIRFTPTSPLPANAYYYVNVTANLKDLGGLSYAGTTGYYFYAGALPISRRPRLSRRPRRTAPRRSVPTRWLASLSARTSTPIRSTHRTSRFPAPAATSR